MESDSAVLKEIPPPVYCQAYIWDLRNISIEWIIGNRFWLWNTSTILICLQDMMFRIHDVGGQKSERRKWLYLFDCVHAVSMVLCVKKKICSFHEFPLRVGKGGGGLNIPLKNYVLKTLKCTVYSFRICLFLGRNFGNLYLFLCCSIAYFLPSLGSYFWLLLIFFLYIAHFMKPYRDPLHL